MSQIDLILSFVNSLSFKISSKVCFFKASLILMQLVFLALERRLLSCFLSVGCKEAG